MQKLRENLWQNSVAEVGEVEHNLHVHPCPGESSARGTAPEPINVTANGPKGPASRPSPKPHGKDSNQATCGGMSESSLTLFIR